MGRRKWVWHDMPPRMKPRRLASGKVLYYYQAGGKQIPLGSNLITAREEWARLEAGGASAQTWPKVTAIYRKSDAYKALAAGTKRHYSIALDNLDLAFKAFTLEQVEPRHAKNYMRLRSKKAAAVFEKKVGSAFFNWAREEGHTKAANPFRGVKFSRTEAKMFTTGKKRPYMTDEIYDATWTRADEILRDAMDLSLYAGQRPGDVLKARRQDIVSGVLWFTQEKTGAKVGVKVVGELARVVERILTRPRQVQSVYLIADRQGQRVRYSALNERWCKARLDRKWQFRDIRGKAGSDSPDLRRAQQLLGHTTEVTTAVFYRHAKGNVVEPLERKIQDVS